MGYESMRFIDEIDDEFICSICTMVLEQPMQSKCDHLFCIECIKLWLVTDNSCPVDRAFLDLDDLKPAARFFRNLLEKLKIKCEFQSKGCPAVVKLEHLENHQKSCEFSPNSEILCDKGCNLKICRRDYETDNCFKHFTDRVICQEDQIRTLNDLVKYQQELNKTLIDDVNRQQVQIIVLNDKVRRMQEQIKCEPLKWRINHNLKTSSERLILDIHDKSRIAFAQSLHSLEPANFFKVHILNWGIKSWIVVGLSRKEHSGYDPPGWSEGSIGYCSNGTFQFNSKSEKVGVRWKDDDVIECGIRLPQNFNNIENYNVIIYLSINSELVTEKCLQMPVDGLFPTICMFDTKVKLASIL